jgi:hypothetical protein
MTFTILDAYACSEAAQGRNRTFHHAAHLQHGLDVIRRNPLGVHATSCSMMRVAIQTLCSGPMD